MEGEPKYSVRVLDRILREMGCESVSDTDDPRRRGWLNRRDGERARIATYELQEQWPDVPESHVVNLLRALGMSDRLAECIRRLKEAGGESFGP